jgi:hypothetical protein
LKFDAKSILSFSCSFNVKFSSGQILYDLHIITEERIILQLYEITQMFVDFLQRYDNMGKDLPIEYRMNIFVNVCLFVF